MQGIARIHYILIFEVYLVREPCRVFLIYTHLKLLQTFSFNSTLLKVE
ncbi:hypothetical protein barba126A_phanotate120 [Rheinheimera phage vB_RspM_barba_12-6A]|uniref:Uncharacterized protein n=31 Tax=Barbavirus barba18A TaxID=2734090 RepID=A0A7G9VRY0_9CAUD|nr:hypothetical protein barba13A_phanotate67 [Rheinheimera phage vB_RspM_barba_1-3A]QNO01585.1 hypothetical protein barba108A_phanotate74 [Rheinheimera phage vB_RspM_barba_10-8A]QNO01712.1 hypothetical protein barba108B_phanotate41 [Rheinheimera phage vB_RspM_barba_10-8B]QNO01906.1 hypothetical protein barba108D_phanotate75 [Rheinheimera phage vB_RspM_barba_10-8D]QNO02063.1 hypothetical protein barba109A_phanotate71 [Rheinheimera phage vB_RspM_barba_10-9A]QNO02229.1 hypothetical protein barba1